jgi:hypothetical protein
MAPVFGDETRRLSAAKAGREQLEKQFARDKAALERSSRAWADAEAPDERLPADAPSDPPG